MVYASATPGERELRHLCEITRSTAPEMVCLHAQSGGGAGPPAIRRRSTLTANPLYHMVQHIDGIAKNGDPTDWFARPGNRSATDERANG